MASTSITTKCAIREEIGVNACISAFIFTNMGMLQILLNVVFSGATPITVAPASLAKVTLWSHASVWPDWEIATTTSSFPSDIADIC